MTMGLLRLFICLCLTALLSLINCEEVRQATEEEDAVIIDGTYPKMHNFQEFY